MPKVPKVPKMCEVFPRCYFRPRHSAWENSCDVRLHENWTLALKCQVSVVKTREPA
jgi:hypothetical protein